MQLTCRSQWCAEGLEVFGDDVKSLLIDLYYYFKRSAAECEDLRDVQIKFGLPEHVLLRHVNKYHHRKYFPAIQEKEKSFFLKWPGV